MSTWKELCADVERLPTKEFFPLLREDFDKLRAVVETAQNELSYWYVQENPERYRELKAALKDLGAIE